MTTNLANLVLPLDQSAIAEIDSLASFRSMPFATFNLRIKNTQEQNCRRTATQYWRQALKILASRGCTSIAPPTWKHVVPQMRMHNRAAATSSRYLGRLGHAGNGDSMLAYHLMDFSRYFFDQSDIRC